MSQYNEKDAKIASELGFTANNKAGAEIQLTGGPNYGSGGFSGSLMEHEQRAKEDLLRARRMMQETELSMDDLIGLGMTDNDPTTQQAARSLSQYNRHQQQQQQAQVQYTPMSMPSTQGGWEVVENVATLNTGKRIKIWTVEDGITQFNTGKNYRVKSVAEKVAAVVNATNNMNDPRISMLNEAHDQYVTLRKQVNKAKKKLNEGKGDRQKLNRLQNQLSQISARLGIA